MKIEWHSVKGEGEREIREGRAEIEGVSYNVRVSYHVPTLEKRFGRDLVRGIDGVFNRLEENDFKRLVGYTVITSLDNAKSFKVLKQGSRVDLNSLKKEARETYKSIKKINKIFLTVFPKKGPREIREDDRLILDFKETPKEVDFSKLLSARNPAYKDKKLWADIKEYNKRKGGELKKKILAKIRKIESDEYKHQVVKLIEDGATVKELRKALGFMREGDIYCDFSQRDESEGEYACGPICLTAIERITRGKKIESERDIKKIIEEGCAFHREKMAAGQPEMFEALLKSFNRHLPAGRKFKLHEDLFTASLEGGIEAISRLVKESPCVFNFKVGIGGVRSYAKTVFAFCRDNRFWLFDSHDTMQNGVTGFGASLRGFDTPEELTRHLRRNYIKKATNFEYHFIQNG